MRPSPALLASAVLVGLLLAGCTPAAPEGDGMAGVGASPTTGTDPTVDGGGASVPPAGGSTTLPTGAPVGEGASAGGDGDRVREDRGWELAEVTADGRHVAIAVGFGGCDRYYGPAVEETAEEVRIDAVFTVPAPVGEIACTGELNVQTSIVALAEPLGDRLLTGCGRADCLAPDDPQQLVGWTQPPAITADLVVTTTGDGIVALDRASGAERWRIAHHDDPFDGYVEQPVAVGDAVAVLTQSPEAVHLLDPADGSVRWGGPGRVWFDRLPAQLADDTAYLTPGGATVEARDPLTGDLRWAVRPDAPVLRLAALGDAVLVVSGTQLTGETSGDTTLTLHAAADGVVRWQRDLPGAPQDLVLRADDAPGPPADPAAVRTGWPDGDTVVVEVEGAVYALDLASGEERWRQVPFNVSGLLDLGPVLGAYPGRYGDPATLVDPATGERIGELPVTGLGDDRGVDLRNHPRIGGDAVVVTPDGTIRRRDATTTPLHEPDPDPVWTTTIPARLGAAATDPSGAVVAVGTPLGVRLLDAATGELVWAHADLD